MPWMSGWLWAVESDHVLFRADQQAGQLHRRWPPLRVLGPKVPGDVDTVPATTS